MLNNFLELLKTVLSYDNLFIRQEILSGRFFLILGGWLEFTLLYNGLLSGLLYGLRLPVDRFSVKSRKLTTLRFVSRTMLRLNSFLNNLMNAFLILSVSGPLVFSKQAKPLSEYKDQLLHIFSLCQSEKCLTEKYNILFSKLNLLNSCSKLVTKCQHESKFYLSNYKDIPTT